MTMISRVCSVDPRSLEILQTFRKLDKNPTQNLLLRVVPCDLKNAASAPSPTNSDTGNKLNRRSHSECACHGIHAMFLFFRMIVGTQICNPSCM